MLSPPVSSIDDRRRHPRLDVSGLSGVLDGSRIFEVLKLSAGGMLIRLPVELELEQRVRVELVLGEETLRSGARVVFLGPDFDGLAGERFRVGLALVAPTPVEEALLRRYIDRELAALEQRSAESG
jgi:hypothetical protein